jgi:hypothetical protein
MIVNIFSTDAPEVSTREAEANDIFDKFNTAEDQPMHFGGDA